MGRRRKTAEERELVREAILAAAEAVFARSGFEGSRIEDVAAEAGVATGTVYNYFASKGDIVVEIRARCDARVNRMLTELVEADGSFEDKVGKYLDGWLATIDRTAWMLPLVTPPHVTRLPRQEEMHRAMFESHARHLDQLARLMAQGIAEGVLDPLPPHDLAMALFGLSMTMVFKSVAPGRRAGKADRDQVLRLFMDGARRTRGAPGEGPSPG